MSETKLCESCGKKPATCGPNDEYCVACCKVMFPEIIEKRENLFLSEKILPSRDLITLKEIVDNTSLEDAFCIIPRLLKASSLDEFETVLDQAHDEVMSKIKFGIIKPNELPKHSYAKEFGDYLETQIYENNPKAENFDRTWYQERFNGLVINDQGDLEIQVDCDSDPNYYGDLVSLAIDFCNINNIEWSLVIVNPC